MPAPKLRKDTLQPRKVRKAPVSMSLPAELVAEIDQVAYALGGVSRTEVFTVLLAAGLEALPAARLRAAVA